MNHLKQILILALFFTVLIASPLLADDGQSVDEQISALIEQLYEADDSFLREDILIAIGEING